LIELTTTLNTAIADNA